MTHKKLSRNAPCPCGSGKRYEACCWDKGLEWVEDEAGTVFRSTPMTPEVREALEQLRQAFEKTGLLVTEQHLIPDEDLAEWDAAIEEYERKHRKR
jgi:hypothetical protein